MTAFEVGNATPRTYIAHVSLTFPYIGLERKLTSSSWPESDADNLYSAMSMVFDRCNFNVSPALNDSKQDCHRVVVGAIILRLSVCFCNCFLNRSRSRARLSLFIVIAAEKKLRAEDANILASPAKFLMDLETALVNDLLPVLRECLNYRNIIQGNSSHLVPIVCATAIVTKSSRLL
jgi:hypothetical protein